MLLFSFSIFIDRRSLKIENENHTMKTLTAEVRVPRVQVYIDTNPGWLELPLTRTIFHGPRPVRATAVLLLYFTASSEAFG